MSKGYYIHDQTTKDHLKNIKDNKQAFPNIHERPQERFRKSALRKKDDEDIEKGLRESSLMQQLKRKNNNGSRQGTMSQSLVISDNKTLVMREIKEWTRMLEVALRNQGKLSDNNISKLQNALQKWYLFLQQPSQNLDKNFQGSRKPTSISTIFDDSDNMDCNMKLKQQKEFYENEMKKLSIKIKEYQQQIQKNSKNNHQYLAKIQELFQLFSTCKEVLKNKEDEGKCFQQLTAKLLNQADQFVKELQLVNASGKKLSTFTEKIEKMLSCLKEYREKFDQIR